MAGPMAGRKAVRYVRRVWPFLVMAYRRWDALTDEEKERYRRTARQTVDRGKKIYSDRRPGRRRKKR
jgi:hypothetical protein